MTVIGPLEVQVQLCQELGVDIDRTLKSEIYVATTGDVGASERYFRCDLEGSWMECRSSKVLQCNIRIRLF